MNRSLHFRLANASEQQPLEELQRRASLIGEEDRANLLQHPDAIELPLGQITANCVMVAEQEGDVVGFAVVLPRADGDAELDGLFVEPKSWRQGIGRRLIEQAQGMAIAAGASHLYVIANSSALDFYTACGFVFQKQVPTRFRPASQMRKALQPTTK